MSASPENFAPRWALCRFLEEETRDMDPRFMFSDAELIAMRFVISVMMKIPRPESEDRDLLDRVSSTAESGLTKLVLLLNLELEDGKEAEAVQEVREDS